jgi:hypothetical protein
MKCIFRACDSNCAHIGEDVSSRLSRHAPAQNRNWRGVWDDFRIWLSLTTKAARQANGDPRLSLEGDIEASTTTCDESAVRQWI